MQQMIIRPWVYPGLRKYDRLNAEDIQKEVAQYFEIDPERLFARKRLQSLVYPRKLYTYFCRHLLKMTTIDIGKLLGQDHTTVIHHLQYIDGQLNARHDNQCKEDVPKIEMALTCIRKGFFTEAYQ